MTLKKSEKILLQILLLLAGFALIFAFLLMPELQRKIELEGMEQELQADLSAREALMANEGLEEAYQTQKKAAEQNYDYFYSVLNGYNIDEIINGIALEKNLAVTSLNIGEYVDAADDFVLESGESLEVLVKSTVDLTVTGSYDKILDFMDAMNAKSPCLRVSLLSLKEDENSAVEAGGMFATFRIYLYGINIDLEDIR